MCSLYSVYDELEGKVDSMVAYQACHLCHNGNKKCERPPNGGQCKRCANTYVPRLWALNKDLPSFSDNKTTDHVWALLHALPDAELSLFENPGAYHTLTICLSGSFNSNLCEPYKIHFLGPLRHDNAYLVQQFDQMIQRDLSAPRVEVTKDPHGLVARACLAGGYLYLFFSVDKINDGSKNPLDPRALVLGLAHFLLMRISSIVGDVMSLACVRPMSRNARLSLAALHVIVNHIKFCTSRQAYLRPLYANLELSMLLKDRIHAIEGELRELFQDDCGLIKDWGAPLNSSRKDFKNTSQPVDPLSMAVAVDTWDDLPEQDMYPTTLSTPSESGLSTPPIGSLPDFELPIMQFAGLEDNQVFETDNYWLSEHTSVGSSHSDRASSMEYDDLSMEELVTYDNDTAYSLEPFHSSDQDIPMADPRKGSTFHQFETTENALSDWELLFNADQLSVADNQLQVLGSPIYWDNDPGTSDVALD